jgi:5-methylcytosine-specific restriction enzyme A
MAVTQGHGNPSWTREETILALALYFELGKRVPSEDHPDVRKLSSLLRSLPYHAISARKQSFRNPAGVAFKLQNLQSVPTGKGLKNVSKTDHAIWNEFGNDPTEVQRLAHLIRAEIGKQAHASMDEAEDDAEFYEGRLVTAIHKRRERNARLRAKLLADRLRSGPLRCDLCHCPPTSTVPQFLDAMFEAHHLKPLASGGEKITKLADVAFLCAGCHRLVHKAIAHERRWLALDECKVILGIGAKFVSSA